MNPKSFNIERLAFLISFGVQITPQSLSIVSLTVMPMLKTITASYYSIFVIYNYIPNNVC
jgi:hypothetical protein